MDGRAFVAASAVALGAAPAVADNPRHLRLRSSGQAVNIGDIAHTPGMPAVLEKNRPADAVTLWPEGVRRGVRLHPRRRLPEGVTGGRHAQGAEVARRRAGAVGLRDRLQCR